MKKRKSLLLSLSTSTLIVTGMINAPIHASNPKSTPQVCEVIDCNPTNSFRSTGVSKAGISYGSFVEVASNRTGASKNGETLSASKSLTYSNSVSGTVTSAYATISSAVGFNATASSTMTASYSLPLNKGQRGAIYARPKYQIYNVKLQRYWSGTVGCNFWKDAGTATVKQFIGFDYSTKVW